MSFKGNLKPIMEEHDEYARAIYRTGKHKRRVHGKKPVFLKFSIATLFAARPDDPPVQPITKNVGVL